MSAAVEIAVDLAYRFEVVTDRRGDWRRDAPWLRKRLYWSTTYSRTTIDGVAQTIQVHLRNDVFVDRLAIHHVAGQLRSADYLDQVYPDRRHRPAFRRRR